MKPPKIEQLAFKRNYNYIVYDVLNLYLYTSMYDAISQSSLSHRFVRPNRSYGYEHYMCAYEVINHGHVTKAL